MAADFDPTDVGSGSISPDSGLLREVRYCPDRDQIADVD
jgi:hypothetical protein